MQKQSVPIGEEPYGVAGGLVSVVITSWNSLAPLEVCLESIGHSEAPPYEVIVVDNCSTDATVETLRARHPDVRLKANDVNVGHTKAVNQGLAMARGRYILVLDADTELDPRCIATLKTYMDAHPDVAMVAPRTFNTDGSVQETARNFPAALTGLFGRQGTLTRLFPGNPISSRYLAREFLDATEPFKVEQIGGACMFFRRTALERVGPWDERYFGYWVDTDWCRQFHQLGLEIRCVPEARIMHHESNARGKAVSPRRTRMFHNGAYIYYTKWHTLGTWDPRSIAAGLALFARAEAKIALSAFRHFLPPAANKGDVDNAASRRAASPAESRRA